MAKRTRKKLNKLQADTGVGTTDGDVEGEKTKQCQRNLNRDTGVLYHF